MSDLELVVARIEIVAKGVHRLTLTHPEGAELPAWDPGAHIDLCFASRGVEYVRQYSLCGQLGDRRHWQVAVLHVRDGRGGSAHIHEGLAEGETVRASLPRNNFRLVDAARYLFIAGGIGITPILPMLAAASAAGAQWRLVYCGRSVDSMAFIDEVLARGSRRVLLQASDTGGRADLVALLAEIDPETVIYCCGPDSMIATIEQVSERWPPGRVHFERFARREGDRERLDTDFEVEFARSGVTVTVPADRSILDMAEDAGIDIDSSCQEGVCGTCETPVLSGTPEHRDEVLTADERAANKTMMVCVSRSCTARLVLDA